jgi:BirA family transcriptional regulator, biotin operon repressor / biotin---[acetyl-CoA-carboxylase] ligase
MPVFTIHRVETIDSTNTQLLQWSATQNCHRVALVADEQTAGRGQRGRPWHAEPGAALLCSVAWQFARHCRLDGLSLAVGVMVADALVDVLNGTTANRLSLKWPNDLLIDETNKLGGILIETVASPGDTRTAVMGIGINLRTPLAALLQDALPGIGLDAWTATHSHRDEVLRRVLAALEHGLVRFARDGFAGFQDQWWARCAYSRSRVAARLPDGEVVSGQIRSITGRGALVIESERGLHTLVSGEVTLRAVSP